MSEIAKKNKFTQIYLHRKSIIKTFVNKNGNKFAVIPLSESEKEVQYISLSTKLVKSIDFSKEDGKTFALSDSDLSPFVQVAVPSDGELTVSVKNKESGEFSQETVKASTLFKTLVDINQSTISWAKNAKDNWVKGKAVPEINGVEPTITDSKELDDDSILWEE